MAKLREWADCFRSRYPASSVSVIPVSMQEFFQVPTQSSAHPVSLQISCKSPQTLKTVEIWCKFVYKAAKQYQRDVQASEKMPELRPSMRVHGSQQHKQIFTGTYPSWNLWDIINLTTNECSFICACGGCTCPIWKPPQQLHIVLKEVWRLTTEVDFLMLKIINLHRGLIHLLDGYVRTSPMFNVYNPLV